MRRVPDYVYVAAGLATGACAIAAGNYVYRRWQARHTAATASAATADSSRSTRLRRSRHVRRRRHRPRSSDNDPLAPLDEGVSPLQIILSDSEDEAEMGTEALFKEWSQDDNKNLLNLIHAISENQARKEGFIHRGITCNKCGVSPIRGIRYKCANCVDFDLCEMCESNNNHATTHVFLKIRIPIPPLANPRSALLPAFYPGKNHGRWILTGEVIKKLQEKSHFDQIELEALYEQFKSLSTLDKTETMYGIDRETFEQCLGPLGLEKNLITERIFQFFDQDRDGLIVFSELVSGLSVLCKGNMDEKVEYAFKGYDLDEDGYISRDELYQMFKSYFYLSMELVRDVVSAMEDEMMDNFEFSASQPVSAAFNVAIPSSTSSNRNSSNSSSTASDDDNDEEEELDGGCVDMSDNDEQGAEVEAGPSASSQQRRKRRKQKYPQKEAYFQQQYAKEQQQRQQELSDPLSPFSLDYSTNKNKQKSSNNGALQSGSGSSGEKKTWEEKFPIMETMSQDAINEMVDKTFKSINCKREGYISLEEFKQCVMTDSSIVSWFEALGTVF